MRAQTFGAQQLLLRDLGNPQAAVPVLHGLNQALHGFVIGLRDALAATDDSGLGLQLTTYSDSALGCIAGAEVAARFDRDTPEAGGAEKRVDESDGRAYTRQEFRDFYQRAGEQAWAAAKPPTGDEDPRKLTAVLFLSQGWTERDGGQALLDELEKQS